jgi:hypothetical protein
MTDVAAICEDYLADHSALEEMRASSKEASKKMKAKHERLLEELLKMDLTVVRVMKSPPGPKNILVKQRKSKKGNSIKISELQKIMKTMEGRTIGDVTTAEMVSQIDSVPHKEQPQYLAVQKIKQGKSTED